MRSRVSDPLTRLATPNGSPQKRHLAVFSRPSGAVPVRSAAKVAGVQVITFAELAKDLEKLPEPPEV